MNINPLIWFQRELMRSITVYLDYLKKQDCYNNSREAELQKIIDAVIEEQYIKVNETRRREQAQRKKLFCVSIFRVVNILIL